MLSTSSRVIYYADVRKKAKEHLSPLFTIDIDARHLPAISKCGFQVILDSINPWGTRARATWQGTMQDSEWLQIAVNYLLSIAARGGVKLDLNGYAPLPDSPAREE